MDRQAFLCFLITDSVRGIRSMDYTNIFFDLSMFYMKNTKTKSRQMDTKFHFFSLLIVISKRTNDGWIPNLFSQLNDTERKAKDGIYRRCFSVFPFFHVAKKNEIRNNRSHFFFYFFVFGKHDFPFPSFNCTTQNRCYEEKMRISALKSWV